MHQPTEWGKTAKAFQHAERHLFLPKAGSSSKVNLVENRGTAENRANSAD